MAEIDELKKRIAKLERDNQITRAFLNEFVMSDRLLVKSGIEVGSGNGMRIGTASTQKLSFYGITPIVQPSSTGQTSGFTSAGGDAVLSASTFTGAEGTKAYTIGDVVKHLKLIGILTQT